MMFTVNVFLSCILYRDAGPGCDTENYLQVGRFLSRVSYLPSYVFLRRRSSFTSRKLFRFISDEWHAFAPFQAKINLNLHVSLRSLIGLFNKSERQAKTIQNVAGRNFTRGFAARKFPRAAPPPLARSRIPPATQATSPSFHTTSKILFSLFSHFYHNVNCN